MTTDRSRTLAWVNEQREALGLPTIAELPRGKRIRADHCPVALGLSGTAVRRTRILRRKKLVSVWAGVSGLSVRIYINGERGVLGREQTMLLLPGYAERFVTDFDAGKHPDLDVNQA